MPDDLYLVTFTHVLSGADVSVKLLAGSETIATWAARLLLNPSEQWRVQRVTRETESKETPGGTDKPRVAMDRKGGAPIECTSGRAGGPETYLPGAHRPPCPLATVRCTLCRRQVPHTTAHRHGRGWVGECCWDERLRASE